MEIKQQKKKINWKLVGTVTFGVRRYFVLGSAAVLLAALTAYAIPLITSFTVDYVIAGEKLQTMPSVVYGWAEKIGGRDYLRSNIHIMALILIAAALLNGVFTFIRGRSVALASEGIAKVIRDTLYRHLQAVPYDYHKHSSTGDLVQRCTSDVDTIRRFVGVQLLEIVRTVAMLIVALIIMFSMHAFMALITTAALPVLFLSSFVYFRKVRKQFTLSDEAEGKISSTLQENLTGVRVVRAFGQQGSEIEKFTRCNAEYRDVTFKLIKMLGFYWGLTDILAYGQICITLVAGVILSVTDGFTLGQVMVFTAYAGMLTWPVRQMGRILADLGKATVSLERIDEILSHPAETEPGKALKPVIKGEIEFKNVCFGYDAYDDVLKDISFKACPGQTIAILGSTGSGKTSLVQLLQRLYTCTAGEIIIDGVNINDIDHRLLRSNIGIVLQEPFLYSRTIRENISIVKPDASDEEVYNAAKIAAVHDVIESFEKKYDTVVGERGVTLSGGQKQRVAIARMLMQNAPILIFDDSMSAVDTETDAAIREALNKRRKSSTTFIISHRITTLCEADNILVLDGGRLVQQGKHEELLKVDGLYARIAGIQNMLEQELNGGGVKSEHRDQGTGI